MPTSHSLPAETLVQAAAPPEGLPQPPQRVQTSPRQEPRSSSSSPAFPDHASSCRRRRPKTWVCTCSCLFPSLSLGFLSCALLSCSVVSDPL